MRTLHPSTWELRTTPRRKDSFPLPALTVGPCQSTNPHLTVLAPTLTMSATSLRRTHHRQVTRKTPIRCTLRLAREGISNRTSPRLFIGGGQLPSLEIRPWRHRMRLHHHIRRLLEDQDLDLLQRVWLVRLLRRAERISSYTGMWWTFVPFVVVVVLFDTFVLDTATLYRTIISIAWGNAFTILPTLLHWRGIILELELRSPGATLMLRRGFAYHLLTTITFAFKPSTHFRELGDDPTLLKSRAKP
jgi:hypothetical protein